MKKCLVAYFSASGTTEKLAQKLQSILNADILEIKPAKLYSEADLDWTNSQSRSSVEMKDKSYRPEIATDCQIKDIAQYDTIFVGFPIWWYRAPSIINSFLEQYDLTGKTIIPFATSGSSKMGDTNKELLVSCKGAALKEGQRFASSVSEVELKKWVDSVL